MQLLRGFALLLVLCARAFAGCEPGDIVYLRIPTSFGRAIEEVTHSKVSHCGVVARHASGHLMVVHALGKVQEEPIERYLERGKGRFAIARYPFRGAADRDRFVAAARALLGRPYDYGFAMSVDAIYCSELVYRAFADGLGLVPVPLHPLAFGAPGTEARRVMERVVHGPVPEGAPGVSPAALFFSPAFRIVENELGD